MRILAIVGSRKISNYALVASLLDRIDWSTVRGVVSGGAKGVDSLVAKYCRRNNIEYKHIYPKWGKYGKSAGYLRNKQITAVADEVIVFWDGKSRGTAHQFKLCKELGKPLTVYKYEVESRTFKAPKKGVTLDDF